MVAGSGVSVSSWFLVPCTFVMLMIVKGVLMFVASFKFLRKFRNKPYDIFGTWFDDTHVLSGDLHWRGNLESCSSLWLWHV